MTPAPPSPPEGRHNCWARDPPCIESSTGTPPPPLDELDVVQSESCLAHEMVLRILLRESRIQSFGFVSHLLIPPNTWESPALVPDIYPEGTRGVFTGNNREPT